MNTMTGNWKRHINHTNRNHHMNSDCLKVRDQGASGFTGHFTIFLWAAFLVYICVFIPWATSNYLFSDLWKKKNRINLQHTPPLKPWNRQRLCLIQFYLNMLFSRYKKRLIPDFLLLASGLWPAKWNVFFIAAVSISAKKSEWRAEKKKGKKNRNRSCCRTTVQHCI